MTNEERDALIERARKTPWLDAMKRRETEALLAALDEARGYAQQLTRRVERGNAIAQRREEELQRERDEARRMLDRMADESHVFNTILESTQRERDEARAHLAALHAAAVAHVRQWHAGDTEIGACDERLDATLADLATAAAEHERRVRASVEADRDQLAALHAAAQRFRDAVSDDGLTCRDNGLDSAAAVEEEWEAIDRVLADLATSAAEHKRRVRAKVIAEVLGLYDGTNGCAAADLTPVIKAAQSLETRIRADERVRALREAADVCRSGITEGTPAGWSHCAERIRAMVDEAERGTR